jgi:hypothetical protein
MLERDSAAAFLILDGRRGFRLRRWAWAAKPYIARATNGNAVDSSIAERIFRSTAKHGA